MISDNNNIFSMGQKQLLCLARAVIRRTQILVLDEATANIDLETDNLIQEKLKAIFQACTVVIIAHRLATVIDSDRILVMDQGRGKEFDHPYKLLVKSPGDEDITNDGYFAQMVKATGEESAKLLFKIAKDKYQKH